MIYVLQGVATEIGKCFIHGDQVLFFNPGCFDASIQETDVPILYDHDHGKRLTKSVEVHADEKALVFRYQIPHCPSYKFSEPADDFDTYLAVSIGFTATKTETMAIDGVKVTSVIEAKLNEISLLSGAPAVARTFARIVSLDTCEDLEDDCESGRFQLHGAYVNLHRKFKASENGGVMNYGHSTSDYDRAANNFERKLHGLM